MKEAHSGIASRDSSMQEFFAPHGWLARAHPRYEFRAGQLEMAELVEAAFREKHHFARRGGTGTGKTLAYLVPALFSGRRVVISTGTKNLQEQIFYQDIPFLERHLGRRLRVSYMKGRNNYLCRQKLYELSAPATAELVRQRKSWRCSASGSRARKPGTAPNWHRCPSPARCGLN